MSSEWAEDQCGEFIGQQWLVFDLGAHTCKLGIDAEETPRALVSPELFVRPNAGGVNWEETRIWIAEPPSEGAVASFNPLQVAGALATSQTWDALAHGELTAPASPPPLDLALEHLFLHFVMNELREDPNSSPMLLTDNPAWSDAQRAHVARILFVKVGVPAVAFVPALVALALSAGTAHALVVDFGESSVRVGLVLAGRLRPELTAYSLHAGAHALKQRLREQLAPAVLSASQLDRALRTLRVAPTRDHALSDVPEVVVDGVPVSGALRVSLAEELFVGDDTLPALVERVLGRASLEERALALNNVVIGGGLAALAGLRERVRSEITTCARQSVTLLKVDPGHGAFAGLTVLASMDIAVATPSSYEQRGVRVGYAPGLFEE